MVLQKPRIREVIQIQMPQTKMLSWVCIYYGYGLEEPNMSSPKYGFWLDFFWKLRSVTDRWVSPSLFHYCLPSMCLFTDDP